MVAATPLLPSGRATTGRDRGLVPTLLNDSSTAAAYRLRTLLPAPLARQTPGVADATTCSAVAATVRRANTKSSQALALSGRLRSR